LCQLIKYCQYNLWANKTICEVIKFCTDTQFEQIIISSFENIKSTCLHIYAAESIWLQRLSKINSPIWKGNDFQLNKNEVIENWLLTSAQLINFCQSNSITTLNQPLAFKNLKGLTLEASMYDFLLHVFNHSSFHRGQLITMLRQVGITDLPITDYIYYCNTIAGEERI
jgi:uncharacterized damage-inducible protein DinB